MRDYFQTLTQLPDDLPALKEMVGSGIDKSLLVNNLFTPHDIFDAF